MTDDTTLPAPKWGDIVPMTVDDPFDLPRPVSPYYVHATNGHFLHRSLAFGHGLVRTNKQPPRLKPVTPYAGIFWFEGPRLPATITAQAVSFFRRIFTKHHTEAEVLITQHRETQEYRLYVPTQRVSHGGVYSIYDPRTISNDYLVIGTIHSHCDFGAYHSGTDEGDARDMDGLHLTIGHILDAEPEVAAMVAMNGEFFNYRDISIVADMSDLTAAVAPEWWDRYVILGKVTDEMRPAWADDASWERYMGRYKPPAKQYVSTPWVPTTNHQPRVSGQIIPFRGHQNERPMMTSEEFLGLDQDWDEYYANLGYIWDEGERSLRWVGTKLAQNALKQQGKATDKAKALADGLFPDEAGYLDEWEEALGREFIDDLYESELFTEADLEQAIAEFPESGTPAYWEQVFRTKLANAATWLTSRGLDVTLSVRDRRVTQLPGQTTIDDFATGVIQ